ncbi:hypothetical protein AAG570_012388 [Ranatra chinensis]|uniref:Calx-beta domain-containing protein n=1 Tax=Ranatra chinensis TaxID=642074 RepID=A0ABD0YIY5_9HEMI
MASKRRNMFHKNKTCLPQAIMSLLTLENFSFKEETTYHGDVFLRLGCDFKETASGRPQLVVSVSSRGFRNCTFSYRPTVVEGTAKCNFAKSNLRRNRRSMRHAGTQITKTKRSEGSVVLNVEEGDSTEITEDMLRPDLPDAIGNEASFKIVSPPEHGDIYVDEESSREFTRDQLEQENVVYVHGGEEIGQSAVYDRFTVATLGENGTIKKVTEFQVSIGPVDDDPPRLNVERSLEVSEGGRVVVDVLQLLDRDTGTEDIACRVVASPSFGHLEAPPGNSLGEGEFKWSLVESGLLIYVQSDHADGLEPKEDAFTVACHDPPDNTGLRPDNLALVPVIIRGTDDEPPRLVAPLLLVLPAGLQELPLARLRITDPDTPLDRVAFTVNRQPAMGKLVLKRDVTVGPVKQFKFGDLDSVFYQYEGGETGGTDDFLLGVYDGLQGSEATIEVEIEDITGRENEAPMMVINEGLEVSQGGTGLITSALLNVHSEDGEVVYVVRDVPLFGSLLLEDTLLQPGSNFTGNDLNEGRLSYVHADPTSSMDVFVFDASDGTGILANQNFFITIRGNGSYPVVTSKTPVLPRGGSLVLDSSLLSARDRNSEDSSSLEFHVMSQPKQGAFEWVDSLGGVQVFTQKDLADGKIRYVHYNSSSFSPPPEIVQFEVTDGHRSVFHSFTINFTREEEDTSIYPPTTIAATVVITSADVAHTTTSAVTTTSGYEDGEPIELVRNAPLTYLLGGAAVGATLTAQHLMALDPDHTTTTYVVRRPPQNGSILDKNTRQPLERFTQGMYPTVTLTCMRPATFQPELGNYDMLEVGPPSPFGVITPPPRYHLRHLREGVRLPRATSTTSYVDFTSRVSSQGYVFIEDHESHALDAFVFVVRASPDSRAPPRDGLANKSRGQGAVGMEIAWRPGLSKAPTGALDPSTAPRPIINPTRRRGPLFGRPFNYRTTSARYLALRDDINEETVFYLLDEGSNATGDSFLFDVIGRGKSLKGIKFSMKWSWVAFVEEFHTVPELPHEYNVKISRRGYIDNMAFVDVSVIGGNASSKYDYNIVLEQVQFSPGQNVVNFPVRIQNDNKFEGPEEVVIALEDSYFTVIEGPNVTKLIITDYDDEPKMNFKGSSYTINEKALQFSVPITREGDLSMKSTVTCNIHNGTAVGDNVDFFMNQSSSVVHFDEGVSENYCTVSIIDDDLLESDEYFFINLSHPTGSILGNIAQTRIVIQQDDNDSEEDYMMVHRKIFFPPNIDHHDIQVYIIDDLVNPKLEGQESFIMYLSNPINCIISDPSKIEVVIDDAMNDVPTVQFTSDEFHIQEIDEVLNAGLVRTGDLSAINTVICYTEEATANSDDYFERPENTQSSITFYPGETHKNCMVILKDDTHFERSERFTLKLKALNSSLKVGSQDSTNVIVTDSEDYDSVKFEKQFMFVSEPSNSNKVGHVKVPIVRNGDISTSLEVHVFTKDGTAKSGIDYLGKSRRLKFEPNNKSLIYDVQILHDELTEMREAFTVHLEMLGGVSDGDEKPQRATVFIYVRTL